MRGFSKENVDMLWFVISFTSLFHLSLANMICMNSGLQLLQRVFESTIMTSLAISAIKDWNSYLYPWEGLPFSPVDVIVSHLDLWHKDLQELNVVWVNRCVDGKAPWVISRIENSTDVNL